jgi:hypothetical protein
VIEEKKRYLISFCFSCNRFFPDFDLVHLPTKTSLIRNLLDNNPNLRRLFSDTFISHFTSNH